MTFFEALLLGLIQGITEWLPISSEGITSLVMVQFFGKTLADAVYYSLWLHLGTLLAAVVYFRKDVKAIVRTLPKYVKEPSKHGLTNFLLIATLCTALIGAPLLLFGLSSLTFSGEIAIALIGLFLLITGLTQLYAEKRAALHRVPTAKIAIVAGLVQGFAALPGLSRSGLTTATLLFAKYDAKQALRLSFLMSIPIVFVAQVGLGLMGKLTFDMFSLLAVFVSFLVGLLTLKVFLRVAERINFGWFCILLGLLSVVQLFF